jgi:TonB-dependent SusC/RagA subfamily outer membrane receptor
VLGCIGLSAQNNNKKFVISGTVLNANKEPVRNAIVMIDDQKTNSVTDADGKYKIKVKPSAVKISIFTFGMGTAEEVIGGRTQIDFNFGGSSKPAAETTIAPGEEGVNTGYSNIKQKNLTTTITKIDGSSKRYGTYSNIYDMIEREVNGAQINGTAVVLQHSKDLFGVVNALIVVDGVTMDNVPDIPPSSVKSIEVLKGTSAAMYGSRGYGGVIVIKTKIQND